MRSLRKPDLAALDYAGVEPTGICGSNAPNDKLRKERLPRSARFPAQVHRAWALFDLSLADIVVSVMKGAVEKTGGRHFKRMFSPLIGFSAEKHDGFPVSDGMLDIIAACNGKMSRRVGSDASRVPSGVLREVFEARGYTA